MSGFGSGQCGICDRRISWDEDFCSQTCEEEAQRRDEQEQTRAVEDAWTGPAT